MSNSDGEETAHGTLRREVAEAQQRKLTDRGETVREDDAPESASIVVDVC